LQTATIAAVHCLRPGHCKFGLRNFAFEMECLPPARARPRAPLPPASQSSRGLEHSKTQGVIPSVSCARSVLECGRPLPLFPTNHPGTLHGPFQIQHSEFCIRNGMNQGVYGLISRKNRFPVAGETVT
jgi:hypothetical protein